MKLSAAFLRRLHWINLPGALLLTLLQRTPVLRVATTAGELIHASPVGHVLRSSLAAVASLGTLHTLAGATTLSVSSGSIAGVTGPLPLRVVATILGLPVEEDAYLHEVTNRVIAALAGEEPARSEGIAAHARFSGMALPRS